MPERSVREVIAGRRLHAVAPDSLVSAACMAMDGASIGALAVLDGMRLTGIVTERDIIRKCIAMGRRTDRTCVADIMTPEPETIAADGTLGDAMSAMAAGGFRHMPVTDGGDVVGMISMRDVPTDCIAGLERFGEPRGQSRPAPA
jgi:CBS domain-containing protein